MNEVLDDDFHNAYPKLENSLKNALFIAIDAEFSGLEDQIVPKLTLFDTAQERYEKQRKNIEPYTAIQIGLTAFRKVRHENKYVAESFKFYLLSRSLPGDDNDDLRLKKTTVKFLQSHSFDFNKWVYGGIPYMNEPETIKMSKELETNNFMNDEIIFSSLEDENEFMKSIITVRGWLKESAPDEKSMQIECPDIVQRGCLQKHLRKTFKTIWTESKDETIVVIKIDAKTRTVLEEKEGNLLDEQLKEYCVGFTKVFKLLCDLKKPIVGHNVLLDLMFMYKQFYRDLPTSYDKFKSDIHKLLPEIYDTKFVAYEFRKVVEESTERENGRVKQKSGISTVLGELYRYFKIGNGRLLMTNPVGIEFPDGSAINTEAYHDAGWDSYYTGYSFIRMANYFAIKRRGGTSDLLETTSDELMSSVRKFGNSVNLTRASISYIKLDGPDPVSRRPPWINIKTIKSRPINTDEIITAISSFDACDVKKYTSRSVLVATPNFKTAEDILNHFKKSRHYEADSFSILKHSPAINALLWGTLVLSGGLLAVLIHRAVQKPVA